MGTNTERKQNMYSKNKVQGYSRIHQQKRKNLERMTPKGRTKAGKCGVKNPRQRSISWRKYSTARSRAEKCFHWIFALFKAFDQHHECNFHRVKRARLRLEWAQQ